ncbi:MAG: fluoride efflux transporter CrcB [Bacteroidetes bacterium]|nr:fluoride efflux transporter CrcB [Bacteroidota bacterium]
MLLFVGFGGFLGSICRFLIYNYFFRNGGSDYPWGTFAANMIGCFLIGLILGYVVAGNDLSQPLVWFFATGFCGAFTTFSTFAYESINLLNSSKIILSIAYIALSVFVGLLFTWLGTLAARSLS